MLNPQNLAIGTKPQPQTLVAADEPTYRQTLAFNVRARMAARPDVDSPAKLARRTFWTDGKRKGRRVSARAIRYVLDPREDAPSPALDLIVAIANGLGCEPWELLVDQVSTRRHVLEQVLLFNRVASPVHEAEPAPPVTRGRQTRRH